MSGAALVAATLGRPTLSLSVSSNFAFGFRYGPGSVQTGTITASAVGGVPPYTYAWSKIAGDAITSNVSAGPTVFFTAFSFTAPENFNADFSVVVTDSVGQTASQSVNVLLNVL